MDWHAHHRKETNTCERAWAKRNPGKIKTYDRETSHKGGKYYEKHKLAHKEGLPGEKERVRGKHQRMWTPFKRIIAPESQLHHQWVR